MSDARPVWLTGRHTRAIEAAIKVMEIHAGKHESGTATDLRDILALRDAAPADATEAVLTALTTPGEVYPDLVLGPLLAGALTPEVLRALGCPRC